MMDDGRSSSDYEEASLNPHGTARPAIRSPRYDEPCGDGIPTIVGGARFRLCDFGDCP
jgi:hypothetical protein